MFGAKWEVKIILSFRHSTQTSKKMSKNDFFRFINEI